MNSFLEACPMILRKNSESYFPWFNDTANKQAGKIIFTCPDEPGVVWGSGVPTCPICPGKDGTLDGMKGNYWEVVLKPGEPDVKFGKKMYIEMSADGKFLGATATPPAIGCSIGRAVIDPDQIRCSDEGMIVAPAGVKCVRVFTCDCYIPEVFPAL